LKVTALLTATRKCEKWSRGSVHTKATRSVSSEGIRNVARREVFGSSDGSEVWKNGVAGNGNKRRPSAERCGTREFGAGAVAAKQQMYFELACQFRPKVLDQQGEHAVPP
jgi:hypothetical protein